jgi:hypothetical protein
MSEFAKRRLKGFANAWCIGMVVSTGFPVVAGALIVRLLYGYILLNRKTFELDGPALWPGLESLARKRYRASACRRFR